MTWALLPIVALAGGTGAALRHLVDLGVTRIVGARFPWGTLLVNVTGSLALGFAAGAVSDAAVLAVVGSGLLGGYTTFSAVAATSAVALDEGRTRAAALNTLGTLVATVVAAGVGVWAGSAL
ncbi:fluoride efflux transporter FluC [Microbacterium sp. GXF7504]